MKLPEAKGLGLKLNGVVVALRTTVGTSTGDGVTVGDVVGIVVPGP